MSRLYGYGEVIPLVPFVPAAGEGVAALFPLLLWGLALALLVIWRHSLGALFEHLAHLFDRVSIRTPFGHVHPLGFVADGLRAVDYAVQNVLAVSANATERAAVYLFHKSLATFEQVGHELYRISEDMVRAVQLLERHRIPRMIATALIPPLAAIAATRTLVHVLRVELRHGQTRARAQIHAVEHATTVALPRAIGRIGTHEGALERDFDAVKSRLKSVEKSLGVAAFTGLVAVALSRLGLRWLRCPSLGRIGRRVGCGGFALLEELLAASFTALTLTDLCTFTGALTQLAEWYRPLLMELVDAEDALIGCHDASKPEPLGLPRLYLAPVPNPLPLS